MEQDRKLMLDDVLLDDNDFLDDQLGGDRNDNLLASSDSINLLDDMSYTDIRSSINRLSDFSKKGGAEDNNLGSKFQELQIKTIQCEVLDEQVDDDPSS